MLSCYHIGMKYPVSEEKIKSLKEKMAKLGIKESEFIEKFVHSQGPGGQKVNKTSSCVYFKHLPTGIEVKCQKERSQSLNRFLARRLLLEKIEEKILKKKSIKQQQIEKIRRQKRRRSRRTKEKILKDKKMQSQKKELRKPPQTE